MSMFTDSSKMSVSETDIRNRVIKNIEDSDLYFILSRILPKSKVRVISSGSGTYKLKIYNIDIRIYYKDSMVCITAKSSPMPFYKTAVKGNSLIKVLIEAIIEELCRDIYGIMMPLNVKKFRSINSIFNNFIDIMKDEVVLDRVKDELKCRDIEIIDNLMNASINMLGKKVTLYPVYKKENCVEVFYKGDSLSFIEDIPKTINRRSIRTIISELSFMKLKIESDKSFKGEIKMKQLFKIFKDGTFKKAMKKAGYFNYKTEYLKDSQKITFGDYTIFVNLIYGNDDKYAIAGEGSNGVVTLNTFPGDYYPDTACEFIIKELTKFIKSQKPKKEERKDVNRMPKSNKYANVLERYINTNILNKAFLKKNLKFTKGNTSDDKELMIFRANNDEFTMKYVKFEKEEKLIILGITNSNYRNEIRYLGNPHNTAKSIAVSISNLINPSSSDNKGLSLLDEILFNRDNSLFAKKLRMYLPSMSIANVNKIDDNGIRIGIADHDGKITYFSIRQTVADYNLFSSDQLLRKVRRTSNDNGRRSLAIGIKKSYTDSGIPYSEEDVNILDKIFTNTLSTKISNDLRLFEGREVEKVVKSSDTIRINVTQPKSPVLHTFILSPVDGSDILYKLYLYGDNETIKEIKMKGQPGNIYASVARGIKKFYKDKDRFGESKEEDESKEVTFFDRIKSKDLMKVFGKLDLEYGTFHEGGKKLTIKARKSIFNINQVNKDKDREVYTVSTDVEGEETVIKTVNFTGKAMHTVRGIEDTILGYFEELEMQMKEELDRVSTKDSVEDIISSSVKTDETEHPEITVNDSENIESAVIHVPESPINATSGFGKTSISNENMIAFALYNYIMSDEFNEEFIESVKDITYIKQLKLGLEFKDIPIIYINNNDDYTLINIKIMSGAVRFNCINNPIREYVYPIIDASIVPLQVKNIITTHAADLDVVFQRAVDLPDELRTGNDFRPLVKRV